MNRAYSTLVLKSVDDDLRILRGIASTPTPDRSDDIVDPMGAEFSLPLPFLFHHKHDQPIGHVTKAKVTPVGIEVEVQIANIPEAGKLKDRVDEAWQSFKYGLVRGLSIGFMPIEAEPIKGSFGILFKRWGWHELSGVTIPANAEANIQTVKNLDNRARAAMGQARKGVALIKPGASGLKPLPPGAVRLNRKA